MKREVIHVDADGVSPDGDTFELVATPDAIRDGFMVNVPVTLVFPDGRRLDTTQAKVTPLGMAVAELEMKGGRVS